MYIERSALQILYSVFCSRCFRDWQGHRLLINSINNVRHELVLLLICLRQGATQNVKVYLWLQIWIWVLCSKFHGWINWHVMVYLIFKAFSTVCFKIFGNLSGTVTHLKCFCSAQLGMKCQISPFSNCYEAHHIWRYLSWYVVSSYIWPHLLLAATCFFFLFNLFTWSCL